MCNLSQGIKESALQEGLQRGIQRGLTIERTENLLEVLEHFGKVPEALKMRIRKEENLDTLKRWFTTALKVESVEQFMKSVNI